MTIDLAAFAQAIVGALVQGLQTLFTPLPLALEQWLLSSIQGLLSTSNNANLLTQNPLDWTSRDPDVNTLYKDGVLGELGIATLVMAIQGIRVMVGQIEMWTAIFRTVFFVLVGEGMLFVSDLLLNITNVAAASVFSSPVDISTSALPTGLELGAALIIAAFFALLAWVKGAVGVVFLKVLIVSAPYLLTASALPLMSGLGTWWAEEFTTWALRPFMVALALRLGLGLAAREGGPIGLLFTVVTFWLAYTMDTRIRRFSVGAWGSVSQAAVFAAVARKFVGVVF